MFRCDICGAEFEEPNFTIDFYSEYFGQTVPHYVGVCPECGNDEYEEMDTCEICGEYIPSGERICTCCTELVDDFILEICGKAREKSIIHKLNCDELISHIAEGL